MVTGVARIIEKPKDLKKIKSGDIIVTMMTQESWLPYMKKKVAGIITNMGDSTCHAALYGKKYSIPVLVGAGNATEKINDGHNITIDCLHRTIGRVYMPENAHAPMPALSYHKGHGGGQQHHITVSHSQSSLTCTTHVVPQHAIHITSDVFHKHQSSFVSYVLEMQNDISWRNWIGEAGLFKLARKIGKCGEFEIRCIPLAYDFFDQDKRYIESILKKIDMDYVNVLFQLSSQKPGDKEWLAHVLHAEHVKKINLPDYVDRQELIENPEKYKQIIDAKKVNPQERDTLIASGLFVRYWVEKKCRA